MLLGDLIVNYDFKRVPLSSKQREQMKNKTYPYYGAQGIIDYVEDYLFDGEYMLIAEDGENLRSRKQPIATIVSGQFWVNNHAHIVTNNNSANLVFLCYWLNSSNVSEYITGSAQPKLNQANMNIIPLPDLTKSQQDDFATVIAIYDGKISSNENHLEILNNTVQTIYQCWFCDFNYPNATGEMRKSEKLHIEVPKNWKEMKFGDFLTHCSEKIGDIEAPIYSTTNNGIALRDEKFNKNLSKHIKP